ncbi:hypothetical protein HII17_08950 [Thalassotalea sp. M1531]|uniref:Uncharacterized protein n=1 Tax=Thalassotalea algicola TaxID=2716224 RepID=A0A7Y0LCJ7_9GAMM|nr:hypothetical protein [Thalassotalea algicola]
MDAQREWHEVTNAENVCLYNKTYNPQRAETTIFSRYPVMAFPPNRLITRENVTVPK